MSTMAQPPAQPRESGALPPPGSKYRFDILLQWKRWPITLNRIT